jgi:G3E family GTPase
MSINKLITERIECMENRVASTSPGPRRQTTCVNSKEARAQPVKPASPQFSFNNLHQLIHILILPTTESNEMNATLRKTTPISVFTGYLGAGKTSVILATLKRVPSDYKIVVLKNEFGSVEVDSELVKESNVEVAEMMNGCLCCVLVGQMKNALEEIKAKYNPDRILVETSGSAFPAPIAWQIREMGSEFELDAIVTVIDCVNFEGHEDTSYTAKLQAQYTDVILLNKWDLVSERQLDLLIDKVDTLNDETPKIKVDAEKGVDPDLIFGIDTHLFELKNDDEKAKWQEIIDPDHHSGEIDILQLVKLRNRHLLQDCQDACTENHKQPHIIEASPADCSIVSKDDLEALLKRLPKEDVFRVKGILRISDKLYILNWAFGRWTLTEMTRANVEGATHGDNLLKDILVKVTVMGKGLSIYRQDLQNSLKVGLPDEGGACW